MALSDRQRAFISEYLVDRNGTKAAIRAGYTPRAARQQAVVLLSNPNIAAEVSKGLEQRLRDVDISAGEILLELYRLATSNLADAFDAEGRLLPIQEMPRELQGCIAGVEVIRKNVDASDGVVDVVHKVKLWDKNKALETLAKYLGLLIEQSKPVHKGEVTLSWKARPAPPPAPAIRAQAVRVLPIFPPDPPTTNEFRWALRPLDAQPVSFGGFLVFPPELEWDPPTVACRRAHRGQIKNTRPLRQTALRATQTSSSLASCPGYVMVSEPDQRGSTGAPSLSRAV